MRKAFAILLLLPILGCSTSRDLTSSNYLPEWKNKLIYLPSPSDSSAGYWAKKSASAVEKGLERIILFPFALIGNVAVNAYFITTWPFRALFMGDKRLIVWYPLFHVGESVESSYFSEQWNQDLV